MAGHCDLPFAGSAAEHGGVGLASTDLLDSHSLLRVPLLGPAATCEEDQPLCMQSRKRRGSLPDAARWAADYAAVIIDINMACPVDKVAKKNGGSALPCDPDSTVRLCQPDRDAVTPSPGRPSPPRSAWAGRFGSSPRTRLATRGHRHRRHHGPRSDHRDALPGIGPLDGIGEVKAASTRSSPSATATSARRCAAHGPFNRLRRVAVPAAAASP